MLPVLLCDGVHDLRAVRLLLSRCFMLCEDGYAHGNVDAVVALSADMQRTPTSTEPQQRSTAASRKMRF